MHIISNRKQCAVEGCPELVAPTMWRHHMTLNAQRLLPGNVPNTWLKEQGLFICPDCQLLVANSHSLSHQTKCARTAHAVVETLGMNSPMSASIDRTPALPTFEDICKLPGYTLRRVPTKARPAFACALSAALRSVLLENTADLWLKLFMLPKCLLLTPKCRGRHHKPISIEYLCDLWLKSQYGTLWQRAIGQNTSRPSHSRHNDTDRRIHTSVALAREGLYGKACPVLTSSGLAPQNNDTWELLLSKHPKGPPPTPPTACSSWTAILPKDFNIEAILRSFPKTTACGPSGL